MKKVYTIFIGQISQDFLSRLQEFDDYKKFTKEKDLLRLIECISMIAYNFTRNQEPIMAMWNAKSELLRFTQGPHMSNQEYFEKFIGMHNMKMSYIVTIS